MESIIPPDAWVSIILIAEDIEKHIIFVSLSRFYQSHNVKVYMQIRFGSGTISCN
jgi:hypothetical protein